jgi:peptidyl-prolyl cis-trans isomerase D
VKTQFGYHIIRRNTYAEAKDQFRTMYEGMERQRHESTYVADVERAGKIEYKPGLAKVVKEVTADPAANKNNRTVIATSVLGDFSGGDVARWITGFAEAERVRAQLQQSPDSALQNFVRYLIRNELFLRQADSAKVQLDTTEVQSIRQAFRSLVQNTWSGLRVAPQMLADSAGTPQERERVAAARVDAYLDRLLAQQEGYVEVPPPLANALRERFEGRVNAAGIDRAVESAQKIRAAADSTRASKQPPSTVPIPGAPGDTAGRGRGGRGG